MVAARDQIHLGDKLTNGSLQYISDTILIEDLIRSELLFGGDELLKHAGMVDDLVEGGASFIQSFIENNIDTSSRTELIKSIFRILESGVLFKIHPVLWIVNRAAQSFGYSITDITSSILSKFKDRIEAGEQINPDEINQAGLSLVSLAASNDLLYSLRKLAINRRYQKPLGGSWFGGNGPWLQRAFGFLGQSKSKSLIVGFVVWVIKTVLLGAGLLAGSQAIKNVVSPDKSKPQTSNELMFANFNSNEHGARESNTSVSVGRPAPPPLKSSGRGEEFFANDNNNSWYISLVNKDPKATLLNWAIEIYPELSGYEDIILGHPSFINTVNLISRDFNKNKDYLLMPIGFNRKIDVVNQFAGNVYKEIKRVQDEDARIRNI